MKEAVTKVIDTLTQEDFQGAFQKLLERYNKCIVAGGDYFEAEQSFIVLLIKVPIRKKYGNLFNYPRTIKWFTYFYLIWIILFTINLLFAHSLIFSSIAIVCFVFVSTFVDYFMLNRSF